MSASFDALHRKRGPLLLLRGGLLLCGGRGLRGFPRTALPKCAPSDLAPAGTFIVLAHNYLLKRKIVSETSTPHFEELLPDREYYLCGVSGSRNSTPPNDIAHALVVAPSVSRQPYEAAVRSRVSAPRAMRTAWCMASAKVGAKVSSRRVDMAGQIDPA